MAKTAHRREDTLSRPGGATSARPSARSGGRVIRREYSRRGILHRLRLAVIVLLAVVVALTLTGHLAHIFVLLLLLAVAVLILGFVLLARRVIRRWHALRRRWGTLRERASGTPRR